MPSVDVGASAVRGNHIWYDSPAWKGGGGRDRQRREERQGRLSQLAGWRQAARDSSATSSGKIGRTISEQLVAKVTVQVRVHSDLGRLQRDRLQRRRWRFGYRDGHWTRTEPELTSQRLPLSPVALPRDRDPDDVHSLLRIEYQDAVMLVSLKRVGG